MSRVSASSIKGLNNKQKHPREGTQLRRVYDAALRGDWFKLADYGDRRGLSKRMLSSEYDLEFIKKADPAGNGSINVGYYHKCVGQWVGGDLVCVEDVRKAIENTVLRDDKGLQDGLC